METDTVPETPPGMWQLPLPLPTREPKAAPPVLQQLDLGSPHRRLAHQYTANVPGLINPFYRARFPIRIKRYL